MKFLKKILVTLITALVTTMAIYGGYTIYAVDYDFQTKSTYITMDLYHEKMNEAFNKSLEKVVKILKETEKGLVSPLLQSPCKASDFQKKDGAKKCEKKCRDDAENVSTYCVSVRTTDMYLAYIGHLGKLQGSVNLESIGWAEPTTELFYKLLLARDEKIKTDIEESRMVLEATLGAYNEFMIAYPIHKQYQVVIKNLIKYKNKLKDVRDYVIQFPSSFIDTTSTKCS